MPDHCLPEDESALYVLGGLAAAERREFQARLAESAELRALVRELEEGAVALALASDRRQPPPFVWNRIKEAAAREMKPKKVIAAFWAGWWRNGWAAAACLLALLFYAHWANRPIPAVGQGSAASEEPLQQGATAADSSPGKAGEARLSAAAESNAARQLSQARAKEMAALRSQVAELENRVTDLSQSVTQQRALLNEPSRLKFFQLTPISGATGSAANQTLSPSQQQALLSAMARELGWLAATNVSSGAEAGNSGSTARGIGQSYIDFIDFLPNADGGFTPPRLPSAFDTQTADAKDSTSTTASGRTIPGFQSGSNTVVVIDASTAPSNSVVSFSTNTLASAGLGAFTMGGNTAVVMLPGTLTNLSVTAGTNTFQQ